MVDYGFADLGQDDVVRTIAGTYLLEYADLLNSRLNKYKLQDPSNINQREFKMFITTVPDLVVMANMLNDGMVDDIGSKASGKYAKTLDIFNKEEDLTPEEMAILIDISSNKTKQILNNSKNIQYIPRNDDGSMLEVCFDVAKKVPHDTLIENGVSTSDAMNMLLNSMEMRSSNCKRDYPSLLEKYEAASDGYATAKEASIKTFKSNLEEIGYPIPSTALNQIGVSISNVYEEQLKIGNDDILDVKGILDKAKATEKKYNVNSGFYSVDSKWVDSSFFEGETSIFLKDLKKNIVGKYKATEMLQKNIDNLFSTTKTADKYANKVRAEINKQNGANKLIVAQQKRSGR